MSERRNLPRDPESIKQYRELLQSTGVLDRPVECLSDEEVVAKVEAILACFEEAAKQITAAMQTLIRSFQTVAARLGEFGERLVDAAAEAAVAEAEDATREASAT